MQWVPDETFSMTFVPDIATVLPHDRSAFTQGLELRDGLLYESTGTYGESTVRIVDPQTGEIIISTDLPDEYFGEGLALVGDRIIQLTWREETAFIWDAYTLEQLGTYSYEGEGWGLCVMNGHFVMSDGSSRLAIRDLDTFEIIDEIDVRLQGEPIEFLNELECTESWIYANVWKTDTIAVIDPGTGFVIARVFADELTRRVDGPDIGVLNGIAYNELRDTYYLTGKYWPSMFEVRLTHQG